MVVPPAPADPGLSTAASADPPRSNRFRVVTLVVLIVLSLVAALALAVILVTRIAFGFVAGGDGTVANQPGREEVMAQTEQFMLRMGAYGPELLDDQGAMPDYRAGVKEVITPKFAASFDQEAGAAEQLVAQAGVARVPDVFATGVSSLDEDSARTLVAGSFTDTYTVKGKTVPQEPIPFRIEVTLVKIDGAWLVDDFNPVTATDAAPTESTP